MKIFAKDFFASVALVASSTVVGTVQAQPGTALEALWSIGPIVAEGQTISFGYGLGEDIRPEVQFFTAAVAGGGLEMNCYSNEGIQVGTDPLDQTTAPGGITGFDVTTSYPSSTETALDFAFASDIGAFPGYDAGSSNTPTVEWCLKVTLFDTGGAPVHYRELALKYTVTLDGNFEIINALAVDAIDAATDNEELTYSAKASLCDADGTLLVPFEALSDAFNLLGPGECRQGNGEYPIVFSRDYHDLNSHIGDTARQQEARERCTATCMMYDWCVAAQVTLRDVWPTPVCGLVTDAATFAAAGMSIQNDSWGGQQTIDGVNYQTYCAGNGVSCGNRDLGVGVTLYLRDGYSCYTKDPEFAPPPTTIGQGTSIFICVESDNSQASVIGIDSMNINSESFASTQTLFNDGVMQRLVALECAEDKCIVEVLLQADFFIALPVGESTPLRINGEAVLQLGSAAGIRTLRSLQTEDATAGIAGQIEVIASATSGAVVSSNGSALLLTLTGALFMMIAGW